MTTRSTRISFFLTSLAGGGAERVMLLLAAAFADLGHDVDLVVTRAAGPYLAEVADNVRVVDLHSSRILTSLPALVKYLRAEHPQAMLSALSETNCVAAWARRLSGVRMRLTLSEHNTISHFAPNAGTFSGRLLPAAMRLSYPKADAIVAVSEGVAGDLATTIGIRRRDITVIYNPIDLSRVRALADVPLSHEWFRSGAVPVVLAVGRLDDAKDYPTLISAYGIIRRQRHVRLMILGEGRRRHELEELVRATGFGEDVALPGFVANPYTYMRNSSVFALCSRWEGLPLVLAEALACGTPVVSTDCPHGPAEILENGRWGRLVPIASPAPLANAIIAALRDERGRGEQRAAAFSAERAISEYYDLVV